jgi:four helix bundle protein
MTKKPIKTFRDLQAWQEAKSLAVAIYHECQSLPPKELHTSYSQMRRSSESVAHNIAEGFGTGTRPGFLRHLRIARGSLCEIASQREFSVDLGIMGPMDGTAEQLDRTHRVLQALITSLETSQRPGPAGPTRGKAVRRD